MTTQTKLLEKQYQKQSGLTNNKHLPKPQKMRRYYTPDEVKLHNAADDCWVSFFH